MSAGRKNKTMKFSPNVSEITRMAKKLLGIVSQLTGRKVFIGMDNLESPSECFPVEVPEDLTFSLKFPGRESNAHAAMMMSNAFDQFIQNHTQIIPGGNVSTRQLSQTFSNVTGLSCNRTVFTQLSKTLIATPGISKIGASFRGLQLKSANGMANSMFPCQIASPISSAYMCPVSPVSLSQTMSPISSVSLSQTMSPASPVSSSQPISSLQSDSLIPSIPLSPITRTIGRFEGLVASAAITLHYPPLATLSLSHSSPVEYRSRTTYMLSSQSSQMEISNEAYINSVPESFPVMELIGAYSNPLPHRKIPKTVVPPSTFTTPDGKPEWIGRKRRYNKYSTRGRC